MKQLRILIYMALIASVALPLGAGDDEPASADAPETRPREDGLIYILPIRGPIEPALLYIFRRGLAEAKTREATAVIFPMDTPGGAVNVTENIVDLIARLDMPTYTFVENNAISAGAIIALATDHIYMSPGSKIGDAMPVLMGPGGGVQELGDDQREKIVSYVDSLIRGVAQRKGRDETMASAMVRPEVEFILDGEVISPEGQLLTMTNVEAERRYGEDQTPLLSEGTFDELEDMLIALGYEQLTRHEFEITHAERIARFLQLIGPLLMMIGFLGIYLEIQSPGFGWPGLVGIVCLALYFTGHHIAGLAGHEEILIFILGIALILVEVLVLPGFGFAGITGIALVAWALLNAMIERFPGDPWIPTLPELQVPVLKLAGAIIGAAVCAGLMGKLLPRTSMFQKLVLAESTRTDEGYSSSDDTHSLVGQEGVTMTPLYPAGDAMFGERKLDVITRGEYIDEGRRVRIVETHGNRIIVEIAEDTAQE